MSLSEDLQRALTQQDPQTGITLEVGTYTFEGGQNQALFMDLLDSVDPEHAKIPSFKQFQNYFNAALHSPKPTKPTRDDPRYEDPTRKAIYSPQGYQFYLETQYQLDLKNYHAGLQRHQAEQAQIRAIIQAHRSSPRGYFEFVMESLSEGEKAFFLQRRKLRISEKFRQRHTYITGQSGSGKTEYLKTLIHHYITTNQKPSVMLLDPHGDIAEQVARFKENEGSERLVYIDPFLSKEHIPVINPFTLPHKADFSHIDLITGEIYEVFREILKASFTPQMETILKPCITTLLMMGDKDINDLQRFMDDDKNRAYLQFGIKHLYNPSQVQFFRDDFEKDTYNPTKQAIKTKIQSLLNSYTFRQMLTGRPTIRLDQLANQRKVIIFNLSTGKMGGDTSDIIGRFLLAQIKGVAFQRADIDEEKRPQTHLFIDECQRYLSPSIKKILTESRKYKLFLTLANQYYGQDMTADLKNAITNNTAIKIAGKNGDKNATTHHKETGADTEELKGLSVGEFHVKEDIRPSIKIKAPTNLLGNRNAMNAEQWQAVKADQLAKYYRPTREEHTTGQHQTANHPTPSKKYPNQRPVEL